MMQDSINVPERGGSAIITRIRRVAAFLILLTPLCWTGRTVAAGGTLMRGLLIEQLEQRALLNTYYVSAAGSNAHAGTSASPWQTLQFAADKVVAGDTVIVHAGTYVGFDLRKSGT